MKDMRILELFAGIGACSKALERLGIDVEIVDAVEIDKYAIASFNAIHGTQFSVSDITEWDKDVEVDLITHGSPCQDFSIAGKQAGGDLGSGTRSSLMYETIRIVGKIRPKYVLWENVKNILSKKHKHNFDSYIETMNILGYNSYYKVLNAKDYGVPQNRERVYTISIRKDIDNGNFVFPEPIELKLRLKDMLEKQVDEKYYLDDTQIERIKTTTYNVGKTRIQEKEYCDTLCARDWKDPKCVRIGGIFDTEKSKQPSVMIKNANKKGYDEAIDGEGVVINPLKDKSCYGWHFEQNVYDVRGITRSLKAGGGSGNIPKAILSNTDIASIKVNNNYRIRKLTPKECWRLMGFEDEDFEKAQGVPTSNTQLYKQAGNSIVVNVLEKIFKNLF